MSRERIHLDIDPGLDGRAVRFGSRAYLPRLHFHDELELYVVTRGQAALLLHDRRYVMRWGTVAWVLPGQDHIIFDSSHNYQMWVVAFRPVLVQRLRASPPYGCRRLAVDRFEQLCRLLDEVSAQRDRDVPRFNVGLAYVLLWAWGEYRAAGETAPEDVHPSVAMAAHVIRTEGEPVKLTVLARKVGLAVSRLRFLFRKQMGVSLVQFRQQQQLRRFLELYGYGERRTMLEAAHEAGFGSYSQFHRTFCRSMGYGPAGYKKRVARGER